MTDLPDAVRPYDPRALGSAVGRLPIHATRRKTALDLDGTWRFQLLPSDEAMPTDQWVDVHVPELWTMREQSDHAQYTNVVMPFEEVPPQVPQRNPVGIYRRDVELHPADGRLLVLNVGAAEGYLRVAVNGVGVGSSTDSHLEAEFDITDAVVDGINTIELRVAKWSGQSYLEDQDHWWQSGISRSVAIHDLPAIGIADLVTTADYDAETGAGSLRVDVETRGLAGLWDAEGWSVEITALGETRTAPVPDRRPTQSIPDPIRSRAERPSPMMPPDFMDLLSIRASGAPVPERFAAIAGRFAQTMTHTSTAGVARDERGGLTVSPWSAESPQLETVVARLRNPEGVVVDEATTRVGFRRVEIVGRDLLVNGKAVLFQGVNRHDIDPRTGRVMSRERMQAELSLLKRFNVNAIRTSHYPNDPYFLELCDEYGFYVVDEADIEGHAFAGTLADDPQYLTSFHERFSRMVIRDRNHPSVIMWSLGNETGYGAAHDSMTAWARRFDPTRPVHYEGAISTDWHAGHAATDVVCPMYPSFESITSYSADPRADRPLIFCEYAYSQGNSTGGFATYWELFETLPGVQGGFVWELFDHALDPDGTGRGLYGGDFGDEPNDGYVNINGVVASDLTPKPAFYEMRHVFAPFRIDSDAASACTGTVTISNRRFFQDLSDLTLDAHVETLSGPTASVPLDTFTVAPGASASIDLPAEIVQALSRDDALALSITAKTSEDSAWAPAGTLLATEQAKLERESRPLALSGKPGAVNASGQLVHPLLAAPPRLSLWRALTDNDESFALDNRFVRSGFFSLEPERTDITTDSEVTTVATRYRAAYGDEIVHRTRIAASGDGEWTFEEDVTLPDVTVDGLRVGVDFTLLDGFDHASWVGLGPWENYPDRNSGALLGRWESSIDDLAVPYLRPQHHGTRGAVTKLELDGPAGRITVEADQGLHATVTRHTPQQLESATHWWQLPASTATIVALDIAHRGVGTAALGPDTQQQYRLEGTHYTWRWRLRIQEH